MARLLQLEPHQPEPPEVACPYCGGEAFFYASSEQFYGGKDYGPLWACPPCHAWVGVHKGTRKPYGRIADQITRRLRSEAHRYLDHMWHRKMSDLWPDHKPSVASLRVVRVDAYAWLASKMDLTQDECHIGNFDEDQCREVVRLCKPFYRPEKLVPWVQKWLAKGKNR